MVVPLLASAPNSPPTYLEPSHVALPFWKNKSPLRSFQVYRCDTVPFGFGPGVPVPIWSRYLPADIFSTVFPRPLRSYVKLNRGAQFFQSGALWTSANESGTTYWVSTPPVLSVTFRPLIVVPVGKYSLDGCVWAGR